MDKYQDSWEIYKSHSEVFTDDLEYYREFCDGFKTLEICAGYGRVSNYLIKNKVEVHVNELSPSFAKFIELPMSQKHIGDVLALNIGLKFDRIIAAYNSFCLFQSEESARSFFSTLERHLSPTGKISLSYYHPDFWHQAVEYEFVFKGDKIKYYPSYDLSKAHLNGGQWTDKYKLENGDSIEHSYEVRLYKNRSDVAQMINHTKLRIIDEVENFNNQNVLEPGWIDYILGF